MLEIKTLQIEQIKLSIDELTTKVGTEVTASIVSSNEDELQFAWYVYCNSQLVEKIMYATDLRSIIYTFNKPGIWVFKAYMINNKGNKTSMYSEKIKCNVKLPSSIDQFPKMTYNFSELDNLEIKDEKPTLYEIIKRDKKYEFIIKPDNKSSDITVMGSGTYDPKRYQLPVFQRFTWMNQIEGNVIYYNDPTLYLGDIKVGWGQGDATEFVLKLIAEIIQIIARKMEIKQNKILFYGSSAAGLMSLILAGYVKGASALVNNPITNVSRSKYYERFFDEVGETSYKDYSLKEATEAFQERQSVEAFYRSINYAPNIYCLVNAASNYDMEQHFKPLLNSYNQLTNYPLKNEFISHLYWDELAQHNPVDKQTTLNFINKVKKMWL